jgi:tetratricopeptide (TPR) repeat protein
MGTSADVDPQKLLQEGHAAFDRGDYASAAALYERAEIHSTDPAQVAFYLAGAKYHLALKTDGPSPELHEAERLYRCCLDPADPRRPLALYGLGNCLLLKAGQRDAGSLRTAIACFDQCLQRIAGDEPLAADARYNREKARLMLLQFQPPARGAEGEKPPGNDTNPQPPRDDPRPPAATVGEQGTEGTAEKRAVVGSASPEPGANATKTDMPPPPGKGNLDPIPDEANAPPLSPRDAAEHLEAATRKVMKERQTHHRRSERPSAAGVKDW